MASGELAALFARRRSKLVDDENDTSTSGLEANRILSSEERDEAEGDGILHHRDYEGDDDASGDHNCVSAHSTSTPTASENISSSGGSSGKIVAQVTPSSSRAVTPNRSRSASGGGPSDPAALEHDLTSENESVLAQARRRLRPTTPGQNASTSSSGNGGGGGLTAPVALSTPHITPGRGQSMTIPRSGISGASTTRSLEKVDISSAPSIASAAATTPATTLDNRQMQDQDQSAAEEASPAAPTPAVSSPSLTKALARKSDKESSVKSLVDKWTSRPPLIDRSSATSRSNFSPFASSPSTVVPRSTAASPQNDVSRNSTAESDHNSAAPGSVSDNEGAATSARGFLRSRELARSAATAKAARNQSLSPRRTVASSTEDPIPMRRSASMPRPLDIPSSENHDDADDTGAAADTEPITTEGSSKVPLSMRQKARMSPSRRLRASPRYQRLLAKSPARQGETKKESDKETTNFAQSEVDELAKHTTLKAPNGVIASAEQPYSLRALEEELDRVVARATVVERPSNPQLREISQQYPDDGDSTPSLSQTNSVDSITEESQEHKDQLKHMPVNNPVTPVNGVEVGANVESGAFTSSMEHYDNDIISVDESISDDVTVKQGNTVGMCASRRAAPVHAGNRRVADDGFLTPKRSHISSSAFSASPQRSPVHTGGDGNPRHEHLLEVENNRLRNELAKVTMDLGVKDAIIADLKQRLNDLQPDEGQRVETESLQRMLTKQKEFVPIPRRRANQSENERRFLC